MVFFFRQLLLRYKLFLFLGKEKKLFIVHGKVCCGVLLLFLQHSWVRRFVSRLSYQHGLAFVCYFKFRSICMHLIFISKFSSFSFTLTLWRKWLTISLSLDHLYEHYACLLLGNQLMCFRIVAWVVVSPTMLLCLNSLVRWLFLLYTYITFSKILFLVIVWIPCISEGEVIIKFFFWVLNSIYNLNFSNVKIWALVCWSYVSLNIYPEKI